MSRKPSIFTKRFPKTSTSPQSRRNLRAFILCLLISFIAWGFIKISDDYVVDFELPVVFYNASQTEIISSQSHQQVTYRLRANGFQTIIHRLWPRVDVLQMDVRQAPRVTRNDNSWAFFTANQIRNALSELFPTDYEVLQVQPDTIFALLGDARQRKVPVTVRTDISFKRGFGLVGSIVSRPDSVYVKGPRNIVDTITAIRTQPLRLEDLSSSVNTQLQLSNPVPGGLLQISEGRVEVAFEVEEFTETSVDLPIKIRYEEGFEGKSLNIRLFPERVKVVCLVPLREFARFDNSLIEAYVVAPSSFEELVKLEVRVESLVDDVRIQGFSPTLVEVIFLED